MTEKWLGNINSICTDIMEISLWKMLEAYMTLCSESKAFKTESKIAVVTENAVQLLNVENINVSYVLFLYRYVI